MIAGSAGRRGSRLGGAMIVALALALPAGPVQAQTGFFPPGLAAPQQAPAPPGTEEGLTDSQLQGYGCLVGAGLAVALVALAGPTEVVQVMGGADFFTLPTAAVVWVSMAAGAGALNCGMMGTVAPAAVHAWNYVTNVSWLHRATP